MKPMQLETSIICLAKVRTYSWFYYINYTKTDNSKDNHNLRRAFEAVMMYHHNKKNREMLETSTLKLTSGNRTFYT